MNIKEYISAMPKAELHLHFEGTIQPEDLLTLAAKNHIRLGIDTAEGIRSLYKYRNFDDFKNVLLLGIKVIRRPDDLFYLMQRLGPRLQQQNIRYAEIFWTPQLYRHLGIPYDELFDALHLAAIQIEKSYGTRINWIPDIVRSRSEFAWEVMEWASSDLSRERGVSALGLAGPEDSTPLVTYHNVFHEAKKRGLPANPHAGESTSPQHIRDTIENLCPSRIGHGIRAEQDPDLLRMLIDKGITLEVCPTSNLSLGYCRDYASHPLLKLLNAGCNLTINTDDPVLFSTDLGSEYLHAVVGCGISLEQLEQIALNAVFSSYLPKTEKTCLGLLFAENYKDLRRSLIETDNSIRMREKVFLDSPVLEQGLKSAIDPSAEQTSMRQEQQEQLRWQLRPQYANLDIFDRMVINEFLEPEQIHQLQCQKLRQMLRHAAEAVPYYQDLFARNHLKPRDFRTLENLDRLPILDKTILRKEGKLLRAKQLPGGEQYFGEFSSSGTTGRPVRVAHSVRSNMMFTVLTQRQYRWYRMDPAGALAYIRIASQLPPVSQGQYLQAGETLRLSEWRYSGKHFHTGPWLGYNVTNPVKDQLRWLEEERPDYLASYSESLEHLCFASEGKIPVNSVKGMIAISEQLTPSMRQRIEDTFKAPVYQSYGLNEIGLTAVQCQFGRYHVHMEHCIVEILDENGARCEPGQIGRIVITALNNYVMPLFRYDTDDLARAVGGFCRCGRILPSFGEISGRYSRIAYLPEGTLTLVASIRSAIDSMPDKLAVNFRQFQLHQSRDDQFELRMVTVGELDDAFYARIDSAWGGAAGKDNKKLTIKLVEQIARTPGGKNLDFISDFMPAPDGAD